MFINKFDPVAFEIFSFEIRWYSLAYIFGILLGYLYCKKILIKDQKIFEKFDDFISYLILGIIFGGRLGYVIFYDLSYFASNIQKIFYLWEGGMSFHGGLIGAVIGSVYFSRKYQTDLMNLTYIISLYAPIGLFFGRLGNFINSELYGLQTSGSWGVIFTKIDEHPRHPSMIYEAFLEGILLFIILSIIKSAKPVYGFISGSFLGSIFFSTL